MTYIYDLVLNFNKDYLEFYEWKKEDNIIYIRKIPIIKINNIQYNEIIKNKIKVTKELLKKIENKTTTDNGFIKYSLLVTDGNYVIALKFNKDGEVIENSKLLFDEELAVLEEISDLDMSIINYLIINKNFNNIFLTRKEKSIKKILLDEIKMLYQIKDYEKIDYLYKEVFSDEKNIFEEYKVLVDGINNNFNEQYLQIYEIIKLTQ